MTRYFFGIVFFCLMMPRLILRCCLIGTHYKRTRHPLGILKACLNGDKIVNEAGRDDVVLFDSVEGGVGRKLRNVAPPCLDLVGGIQRPG